MKKLGNFTLNKNAFQLACESLKDISKVPNLNDDIMWKYGIMISVSGNQELARKWKVNRMLLLDKLNKVPDILLLKLLISIDIQIGRTAEDYHRSGSKDALSKFQELVQESPDHVIILSQ